MKLDNSGNILQKKTFDTDNAAGKYTTQSAHSVHIAQNGDFLIGGERGYNVWIMRLDSSGTVKWATWYYDSIRDQPILNRGATINSLLETPSGKIVCAAGDEFPNNGGSTLQNYAAYLAFDSTGKLSNWGQWDRETGYNIGGFSIAQSSNTWLQIAGNQSLFTVDETGELMMQRNYTFTLEKVGTVTNKVMRSKRLRDGRMVVIGQSYEPDCWTKYSRYSWDAWWSVVTLTGSSMEADWVRNGVSGGSDGIYDVTDLVDGKLAFVGIKATPVDSGIWVFVTDSLGKNILWERQYDLPGVDTAGYPLKTILPMAICATPDSGFTIVGDNNTFGNNHNACAFHFVPRDPSSATLSTSLPQKSEFRILSRILGSRVVFTVVGTSVAPLQLSIYSASGRVVEQSAMKESHAGKIELDCTAMSRGIYLYRISTAGKIATGTFVIGK